MPSAALSSPAPTGHPCRVLVADDLVLVRAGVTALLDQLPGYVSVGAVEDGQACLVACADNPPDILLLDLRMPGLDGLSVAAALRDRAPQVRIVFLSAHAGAAEVSAALRAGARGFLAKDFVLDELGQALDSVAAGRRYLSASVAAGALEAAAPEPVHLSPRQCGVLRGIARGQSNKLIARDMGVSVKTVAFHRAELIQRLDLHDVASLTRYALEHGLAD